MSGNRRELAFISSETVAFDVADDPANDRMVITANVASLGNTDTSFVWHQDVPAAVWSIAHNLGAFPAVTVIDSAGDLCEGVPAFPDGNHLTITFSAAFSGVAYLNA